MRIEPSQKSLKARLRKEIRQRRAAIDPAQRDRWDARIHQNLQNYVNRTDPKVIAAYLAFDGEPDLLPALTRLGAQGLTLALPVIVDAPGKEVITFRQWAPGGKLVPNRFGISEPFATGDIRVTDIDLVLVPLVGWDRSGGRLGMGASFYDRLFQPFEHLEKPRRMGVGYELQQMPRIPREPWDIKLHAVLTESGCQDCED